MELILLITYVLGLMYYLDKFFQYIFNKLTMFSEKPISKLSFHFISWGTIFYSIVLFNKNTGYNHLNKLIENSLTFVTLICIGLGLFYQTTQLLKENSTQKILKKTILSMIIFIWVVPFFLGLGLSVFVIDLFINMGFNFTLLSATLVYLFLMIIPEVLLIEHFAKIRFWPKDSKI